MSPSNEGNEMELLSLPNPDATLDDNLIGFSIILCILAIPAAIMFVRVMFRK